MHLPAVPEGAWRGEKSIGWTDVPAGGRERGDPVGSAERRGTRRETPVLGTCRAGAPSGAQRCSKDSPSGESKQSQYKQGSWEEFPGTW
ncbi:hypothetical protein NDU88_006632 [Pleurodeles waltl]|uniref:Uncharacterized protein n=1 Tax=Pleurodeles waltl TaxID=8319 RepID=A0AAV7SQF7_PLEWA|nr:hypothetical protein NDU88_006632 [Pleurodeles waltl]